MIKEISISNFQSHKDSHLKFHSGVNAIVGNSDSGKSAIIRALNWILNNRPSGDSFRSNWGGDTGVEIIFDDCVVSRLKTEDKNMYLLHDSIFKALNGNIPDEIKEAINMSEVNVQCQLDSPFMLSASSGEVAKTLNKIANLTSIDNAISNIKKKVTSTNREIEDIENQIKELEENAKAFSYLPDFEKLVVRLEKYEDDKKEILNDEKYLKDKIAEIAVNLRDINELDSILTVEPLLTQALTYLEEQKGLDKQVDSLNNILSIISKNEDKILKLETNIEIMSDEFKKLMPNICPLCGGSK